MISVDAITFSSLLLFTSIFYVEDGQQLKDNALQRFNFRSSRKQLTIAESDFPSRLENEN